MSRGDEEGHGSALNYSPYDLEKHAVELARLATTFDKQENWEAASYYYQVRYFPAFLGVSIHFNCNNRITLATSTGMYPSVILVEGANTRHEEPD